MVTSLEVVGDESGNSIFYLRVSNYKNLDWYFKICKTEHIG